MPEKAKKYEERLAAAFGYDDADLDANHEGRLSPSQVVGLKAARNEELFRLALLAITSVLIALGFYWYTAHIAAPLAVLAIAGGLLLALEGPKLRRLRHDLREAAVLAAEGRIDLALDARQNKVEYFLRVEGIRFPISKSNLLALKNGDPYRIYYTPRTKRIVAVEWLRDGNDDFVEHARDMGEQEALNSEFAPPDEKPKRLMQ